MSKPIEIGWTDFELGRIFFHFAFAYLIIKLKFFNCRNKFRTVQTKSDSSEQCCRTTTVFSDLVIDVNKGLLEKSCGLPNIDPQSFVQFSLISYSLEIDCNS